MTALQLGPCKRHTNHDLEDAWILSNPISKELCAMEVLTHGLLIDFPVLGEQGRFRWRLENLLLGSE